MHDDRGRSHLLRHSPPISSFCSYKITEKISKKAALRTIEGNEVLKWCQVSRHSRIEIRVDTRFSVVSRIQSERHRSKLFAYIAGRIVDRHLDARDTQPERRLSRDRHTYEIFARLMDHARVRFLTLRAAIFPKFSRKRVTSRLLVNRIGFSLRLPQETPLPARYIVLHSCVLSHFSELYASLKMFNDDRGLVTSLA